MKFSPPVNRVVTSKDVAYGIERGFLKTVNGQYVGAYMGDLVGLKAFQDGKAKQIAGIQTPDDTTIVFKLDRPRGADLRRRACPARLRSGAARVRGEVRRREPDALRPQPGGHRART